MEVPLPDHEAVPFEGTSLRPILEDPEHATVKTSRSQLSLAARIWGCRRMGIAEARCVSIYIIRNARIENVGKSQSCMVSKLRMICKQGGQDNTCLDVERASFTWMGYTMRTERYRYTEYVVWNGTTLSPIWEQVRI